MQKTQYAKSGNQLCYYLLNNVPQKAKMSAGVSGSMKTD